VILLYAVGLRFVMREIHEYRLTERWTTVQGVIGATTVGTGEDWSPATLRLGDQQYIGPPTFWS